MYITITRQHSDSTYNQSASDFVDYLEKENEGKHPELQEPFFDQYNDRIERDTVVREIDANTSKLKKREPKFYSLTVNPSQRELKALNNDPALLRYYVREMMKDYATAFYRESPVHVDQLKYYAKIEHERTYSGKDWEVQQNRPYAAKIAKLQNDIRKVERGELKGNIAKVEKEIDRLFREMPHKMDGKPVKEGMQKPGDQMHVHIIMSRKDVTNRYSLSPGSSYRESEAPLQGEVRKRGFKRDQFFEGAEKTFDRLFGYDRNYVESYQGRKTLGTNPHQYFAKIAGLPKNEKAVALKLLGKTGIKLPLPPQIPKSKLDLMLKSLKKIKRGIDTARGAGAIEI
ncbi:MobB family relaxase [Flagellimonas nanhaiensis]|uniref:Mobilization protein n=1 Tax=Flagellimonas nanhaiensis TaxID=2292706 RepID=A0A371JLQ2_9FLAO|nr:MobB family relaxase [Allomuricauda nanhaiensis]RDY57933.1 mobilization protein [Allomuricauda nanhaiensis]